MRISPSPRGKWSESILGNSRSILIPIEDKAHGQYSFNENPNQIK